MTGSRERLKLAIRNYFGVRNFLANYGFMQKIMNPFPLSTGKLDVLGIHF